MDSDTRLICFVVEFPRALDDKRDRRQEDTWKFGFFVEVILKNYQLVQHEIGESMMMKKGYMVL